MGMDWNSSDTFNDEDSMTHNDVRRALQWAIAEIEGRTRYTSAEQREACLEKASATLAKSGTAALPAMARIA
jgi:lipid A disaccharide synthetase